jgi:ribonuclease P protein component
VKSIYSLKGRNLFKDVYLKGRRIQDTGIRVYTLKSKIREDVKPENSGNGLHRIKNIKIAIALTRSFGKSHIRNKAKRRIRAICTELLSDFKEGFFIIIRIDSDFSNYTFEDQKRIIITLFTRAGLLNTNAHKSV